jgi:hypothetical protein
VPYKVKVPITHWQDIRLDEKQIIELLEQEKEKLAGKWECIRIRKDGTGYYHNRGYGSHKVGEEDGPDITKEVYDDYMTIDNMIKYFNKKIKSGENK